MKGRGIIRSPFYVQQQNRVCQSHMELRKGGKESVETLIIEIS